MPTTKKPIPGPTPQRVANLLLDELNPRLPEALRGQPQSDILRHMQREYDLIRLGRSISANGYFPSEPLIAIRKDSSLVVVEGNRRLATLLTLSQVPELGQIEQREEWLELSRSPNVPNEVPVVIALDREQVAPIIGYRHIAGIEPWDPWAKARYIAYMVEEEGLDFDTLAGVVSEDASEVRTIYRNYRVLHEARERFKIDTSKAEEKFGVFTRSMSSAPIKEFIGINPEKEIKPNCNPIPTSHRKEAAEIFGWMFGDNKVINDSRDLTRLGNVLASESGVKALRRTKSLEEAEDSAGEKKDRVIKKLNLAASHLENLRSELTKSMKKDDRISKLLKRCSAALSALS